MRDFGLRSREFHAPWDPLRPTDYWELPRVAERLRVQEDEFRRHASLCLCFSEKNDPARIIGVSNLRNIIRGAMLGCHLGYALAPDAIGRGYMTEAVQRTVRIAFEELALHRVEANVIPRNAKSLAVLERAGFSREGLSPKYLRIAGVWEDHVRFAIINEELR